LSLPGRWQGNEHTAAKTAGTVVDHFAWVGFEPKPISAGRLVGMGLVGAGVVLVRVF
jgi:uncharacterized membrane protein YdcZ (DUF606 family)